MPIAFPTPFHIKVDRIIIDAYWIAIICTSGLVQFWGREMRYREQGIPTPSTRLEWTIISVFLPDEIGPLTFASFFQLNLHATYGMTTARAFLAIQGELVRIIAPENGRCLERSIVPSNSKESMGGSLRIFALVRERFLCIGGKDNVRWFDLWGNFSNLWEYGVLSIIPSEQGLLQRMAEIGPELCVLTTKSRVLIFRETTCLLMKGVTSVKKVVLTPRCITCCLSEDAVTILAAPKRASVETDSPPQEYDPIPKEENPWINIRLVSKLPQLPAKLTQALPTRRRSITGIKAENVTVDDPDIVAIHSKTLTLIVSITPTRWHIMHRLPLIFGPIIDTGWFSWVHWVEDRVYIFPGMWSTGHLNRTLVKDENVECAVVHGGHYCTLSRGEVRIRSIRESSEYRYSLPNCSLLVAPSHLIAASLTGGVWWWDHYDHSKSKLMPKIQLPLHMPIIRIELSRRSNPEAQDTLCMLQKLGMCVVLQLPLVLFQVMLDQSWVNYPIKFYYSDERLYVKGGEDGCVYVWNDDRTLLSKNAAWPEDANKSVAPYHTCPVDTLDATHLALKPFPKSRCNEDTEAQIFIPFFMAVKGVDESLGIRIRVPWCSYVTTMWALLYAKEKSKKLLPQNTNVFLLCVILTSEDEPFCSRAKNILLEYFETIPFCTGFRRAMRPWALRMQMCNDIGSLFALTFALNSKVVRNRPKEYRSLIAKVSLELQAVIFGDETEFWQKLAATSFIRSFYVLVSTDPDKSWHNDLILKCFAKYQEPNREIGLLVLDIMVLIGDLDPTALVQVMAKASRRLDLGHKGSYSASALLVLTTLVRQRPKGCSLILPLIVETVLRCLEPSDPAARKTMLVPATQALHQIVQVLPMATFHQKTQRYAIGTQPGLVHVYDLRTATKWRILEGHQSKVLAVGFAPDGEKLASYAADGAVMLWQISSSGILGFLGVAGKLIKATQLEAITTPPTRQARMSWTTQSLSLVRENGVSLNIPDN